MTKIGPREQKLREQREEKYKEQGRNVRTPVAPVASVDLSPRASGRRSPIKKSNAEKQRAYRERKKAK